MVIRTSYFEIVFSNQRNIFITMISILIYLFTKTKPVRGFVGSRIWSVLRMMTQSLMIYYNPH